MQSYTGWKARAAITSIHPNWLSSEWKGFLYTINFFLVNNYNVDTSYNSLPWTTSFGGTALHNGRRKYIQYTNYS